MHYFYSKNRPALGAEPLDPLASGGWGFCTTVQRLSSPGFEPKTSNPQVKGTNNAAKKLASHLLCQIL